MENLQTLIANYLKYCGTQKRLDEKTLKAYRIDLRQFSEQTSSQEITDITSENLKAYIAKLHQQYTIFLAFIIFFKSHYRTFLFSSSPKSCLYAIYRFPSQTDKILNQILIFLITAFLHKLFCVRKHIQRKIADSDEKHPLQALYLSHDTPIHLLNCH